MSGRVRNTKTGSVHGKGASGKFTSCHLPLAPHYKDTDAPVTCGKCMLAFKGFPSSPAQDPVYELATDIGGDLPDGAFWALHHELGG